MTKGMRKRSEAPRKPENPAVAALSQELNDRLEDGKVRDAAQQAGVVRDDDPPLFEHVNRAKLAVGFEEILRVTFVPHQDVWPEYRRLVAALKIGEGRSDTATLREALDDAEDNARRAHALYLSASTERERFDLDAEPAGAAMWEKATRVLQQEKEQGLRNKAITDADVRAMAATLFPDEWRAHELKKVEVKRMVEGCEELARRWGSRCVSLRTMLETLRRG